MQSRWDSFLESSFNIITGFTISLLVWMYVVIPVWGLELKMTENLSITLLFTVVSLVRSYLIRRFFNVRSFFKSTGTKPA